MAIQQTAQLNEALQAATDRRASDVYLVPGEPVVFRVDGVLVRGAGAPLSADEVRATAEAAVGAEAIASIGPAVGRASTSCSLPGLAAGHVCVARSLGRLFIVVRLLPRRVYSLDDLSVPEALRKELAAPHGLIVFTGAVGSGKTTTVFACLEHLNATRALHLCTIEDPPGYVLDPKRSVITQREIGVDAPDTASAIAACMQQDPDVLFVSETRTFAEVAACVRAAQNGHLVMLQLHAPTVPAALERLVGACPSAERPMFCRDLAEQLRTVCAQQLLRRADGRGRVPAYSVLVPDAAFREALGQGTAIRALAMLEGFVELAQAIRALGEARVVAAEEVRRGLESL